MMSKELPIPRKQITDGKNEKTGEHDQAESSQSQRIVDGVEINDQEYCFNVGENPKKDHIVNPELIERKCNTIHHQGGQYQYADNAVRLRKPFPAKKNHPARKQDGIE